MLKKIILSETTNDEVFTAIHQKSHKGFYTINKIDDATEHIKIMGKMTDYFKTEDIKWIEMPLKFEPVIPVNTLSYLNTFNNHFVCHIEDFEKFYFANFQKIITENMIFVLSSKKSNDGWIMVGNNNNNKDKKLKYKKVLDELTNLVGDWNAL